MASGEAALREQIVEVGRSLFDRGLTAGSSGNISVRVDDGWLLTPTNASLGRLDPANLAKLDWDGRLVCVTHYGRFEMGCVIAAGAETVTFTLLRPGRS